MSTGAAYLQSRQGTAGPWSDRIDRIFAAYDVASHAGLNLAVVKNGETVHARGYGVAEIEHDIPFTPHTVLRLGSTSKHVCAACIYVLVREGKLSVEDDVRDHVPEMKRLRPRVTIDHLLTMTSGLPEWLNLALFSGMPDAPPVRRTDMLDWLTRLETTMFPPGATSSYSNTNYALLSLIVERVSGQSLAAFMRERLFEPLGMRDTQLVPRATQTIARMAKGYQPGEGGTPVEGQMLPEIHGEGAVNSTLSDMTRWLLSYRAGGAVPGLRTWLEEGAPLSNGTKSPYRRAIVVDAQGGVTRVGHAGGMPGYLSEFAFYPELDVGVVMLTNWFDPAVFVQVDPIAEIVSERRFITPPAKAEDLPATGLYVNDKTGHALQFNDDGSCHCLGETIALLADGRNRWRFAKRGDMRTLSREPDGNLTLIDGALPPNALTKCGAPLPVADPARYVGLYRCPSLGERHEIRWNGKELSVSSGSSVRPLLWSRLVRRAGELFTAPIDSEPSETNVTLRFTTGPNGAVTGFDYSISRIYGLRFERERADA
jgi:CubicO group peptidase (beta-lactamase class C family)